MSSMIKQRLRKKLRSNYIVLLQELEKAKTVPFIIVEGKKDKDVLQELGFNNVVLLHENGNPLYAVLDKIKEECVILTDFDKKGKEYYATLKKELLKRGIKVNDRFRRVLLRERISHIEGITAIMSS